MHHRWMAEVDNRILKEELSLSSLSPEEGARGFAFMRKSEEIRQSKKRDVGSIGLGADELQT